MQLTQMYAANKKFTTNWKLTPDLQMWFKWYRFPTPTTHSLVVRNPGFLESKLDFDSKFLTKLRVKCIKTRQNKLSGINSFLTPFFFNRIHCTFWIWGNVLILVNSTHKKWDISAVSVHLSGTSTLPMNRVLWQQSSTVDHWYSSQPPVNN